MQIHKIEHLLKTSHFAVLPKAENTFYASFKVKQGFFILVFPKYPTFWKSEKFPRSNEVHFEPDGFIWNPMTSFEPDDIISNRWRHFTILIKWCHWSVGTRQILNLFTKNIFSNSNSQSRLPLLLKRCPWYPSTFPTIIYQIYHLKVSFLNENFF